MWRLVACGTLALTLGCQEPTAPRTPDVDSRSSETNKPNESSSSIRFEDVTDKTGVAAKYKTGRETNRFAILESLGGGVGATDFDRDGQIDLLFPGGGQLNNQQVTGLPTDLFRNRGALQFDDVGEAAGIRNASTYTHGCAIDDFDSDGFDDLIITGYGGLQFFRNQGDGTFAKDRSAGLDDARWSSSAAWGDIDGDGHPDLYITHYVDWSFENDPVCPSPTPEHPRDVCPPRAFDGVTDTLYLSNGDGTFANATASSGLVEGGKGLGVILFDIESDGDLDIYVANDMVDNFLYVNDGSGKLTEAGLLTGTATDFEGIANGSMGLAICDYNADTFCDLWVTNFEEETFALYRNDGSGNFVHASRAARITALGGLFVGFGTAMGDLDLDGDEDAIVANGHVIRFPKGSAEQQHALLLENNGDGQFDRVIPTEPNSYFASPHIGRGIVLADLNNDRRLDAVVVHSDENAAVLKNTSPSERRSFSVELIGRKSPRNGVGSTVILETSAGDQVRQIAGGGSYLSAAPHTVHFGIEEDADLKRLRIRWPSGINQIVPLDLHRSSIIVHEDLSQ